VLQATIIEAISSSKHMFLLDLEENLTFLKTVILIIWFTPPVNCAILIDNKCQRQDLIKLQFLFLNLQVLMFKCDAKTSG